MIATNPPTAGPSITGPSAANPVDRTATSSRRRRTVRTLATAAVALAIAAGCSGDLSFSIGGQSVEDAAVELIEGELADGIGLGALEADCPEVPDPEVGTEFACTATTPDGVVIEIDGLVDREDHIDLQTANVIVADALGTFEAAGIDVINQTEGATLDASAMDCGDSSIVIPDDGVIGCELTLPDTGELYDVIHTVNDLASGDIDLEWFPQG